MVSVVLFGGYATFVMTTRETYNILLLHIDLIFTTQVDYTGRSDQRKNGKLLCWFHWYIKSLTRYQRLKYVLNYNTH